MRFTVGLLIAAACFGQGKQNIVQTGMVDAHGANWIPPTSTFASPPSSPATGSVYIFTDASSVGSCSGGGSALATCRWSGAAWSAVSGGARRTCIMLIGADNGGALVAADMGPQGRQCFIPSASTVVEISLASDAGTPTILIRKNHAGATTNLTSAAFATGAAGALSCANAAGSGTGIDGATTCATALSATALAAGDWLELGAGAASTAKRVSVSVTYTVVN
ncbi:MAG: hypothetical protein NTW28_15425 [Candidatus Solibacter sp.]|nr:hypothetical protein [Candidatus Solibacter sp.]